MYRSIKILTRSSEVAKYRSFKSKKELEKEGRTLGVELDRRHSKEDLIEELEAIKSEELPRFSTDAEAGFKEEPSEVTWNSIEEFTEAVTSTGMIFDSAFIPVNIKALYEAYTSNSAEFKETAAYKFLTK
jgi:hypothetical protein